LRSNTRSLRPGERAALRTMEHARSCSSGGWCRRHSVMHAWPAWLHRVGREGFVDVCSRSCATGRADSVGPPNGDLSVTRGVCYLLTARRVGHATRVPPGKKHSTPYTEEQRHGFDLALCLAPPRCYRDRGWRTAGFAEEHFAPGHPPLRLPPALVVRFHLCVALLCTFCDISRLMLQDVPSSGNSPSSAT